MLEKLACITYTEHLNHHWSSGMDKESYSHKGWDEIIDPYFYFNGATIE